jgi:hypothetical protein
LWQVSDFGKKCALWRGKTGVSGVNNWHVMRGGKIIVVGGGGNKDYFRPKYILLCPPEQWFSWLRNICLVAHLLTDALRRIDYCAV